MTVAFTLIQRVSYLLCSLLSRRLLLCVSGLLGLLSLLHALGGSALLLALLDGGLAGSRAGLGALCATLLDDVEGSTDDGTLGLDLAATAGLGGLLWWV